MNFMTNYKKKTFILFKWDLIREREEERQRDQAMRLRKKKFVHSWMKLMILTKAVRKLFTQFDIKVCYIPH